MPIIFGTRILTATYNEDTLQIALTGQAFGINEYAGTSNIEVSLTGAGVWIAVASIDTWGDEAATGTLAAALGTAVYDVRVTSSDGEEYVLTGAIDTSVPVGPSFSKIKIAIGMGI